MDKKIKIIKNFILFFQNPIAFGDFIALYKGKILSWIRGRIFNKDYICDDEDIFQLIQIDLWKYNSFENFRISDDDAVLVRTFEYYLKNTIVKRSVANYFRKKGNRLAVEHFQHCEPPRNGDENEAAPAPLARHINAEAWENFKTEAAKKNTMDLLEEFYKSLPARGNAERDFKMFIKNKIDGYSVGELAKEFGMNPRIVSTSIWRMCDKIKTFSKKKFGGDAR